MEPWNGIIEHSKAFVKEIRTFEGFALNGNQNKLRTFEQEKVY